MTRALKLNTPILKIAELRTNLEKLVAGCKQELAEFADRVVTNPVGAFEWADSYIATAAQLSVAAELLELMDGEESTDKEISDDVYAVVLRQVTFTPSMNGSTCQTFLKAEIHAQWCRTLKTLDRYVSEVV